MTEEELEKLLDVAERSPKEIAAAVSGLPEEVLRYKPSPERWCVLEILGHLADVEIIYGLGRHHNLRLLRSLQAADLSKSAFHPETQREVTVADLVQRMAGHGTGHLQQIEKLKAAARSE